MRKSLCNHLLFNPDCNLSKKKVDTLSDVSLL